MNHLDTIAWALFGGVAPALVWLLFWLREDRKHPEPNRLILKTFLFGMCSVVLVIPIQKGIALLFPEMLLLSVILWAIFEEMFKFWSGYFGGLRSKEDDEPIDPMIYMVTAALGFVALENTFFIFGPLLGEKITQGIITGNLRFVGASLLHVVASGMVGASLAFSYYQSNLSRHKRLLRGAGFAILFHALFNILILFVKPLGTGIAFLSVWIGVVWLLLAFERAKTIAVRR